MTARSEGVLHFFCHAHAGSAALEVNQLPANAAGWREGAACPVCGAITRARFAAEWIARLASNRSGAQVYVTEQLTPLYRALRRRMPALIGSEFVPDEAERSSVQTRLRQFLGDETASLRHEDITALSFPKGSLDLVGCFDVLEHLPDEAAALEAFFRVLAPQGALLLSVPFLPEASATLVRALPDPTSADGVRHLLPPEYHGDPTDPDGGILCYRHFGWDLLEKLRGLGFASTALLEGWGEATGVFGDQQLILAVKPA
ncbi:MAG: class I SAM-dependent methyltransferase [Casimicrobiaceae bacterium]|nr:class I SAM-dependent methyltransferase [Casimicrobiaceae bacterium]